MSWYMEQLYSAQFELMVTRWREENSGEEPDDVTRERLRTQARMVVDDIDNAQRAEVLGSLYTSRRTGTVL